MMSNQEAFWGLTVPTVDCPCGFSSVRNQFIFLGGLYSPLEVTTLLGVALLPRDQCLQAFFRTVEISPELCPASGG